MSTGMLWGTVLGLFNLLFGEVGRHGFSLQTFFSLHFYRIGILSLAISYGISFLFGLILWHFKVEPKQKQRLNAAKRLREN